MLALFGAWFSHYNSTGVLSAAKVPLYTLTDRGDLLSQSLVFTSSCALEEFLHYTAEKTFLVDETLALQPLSSGTIQGVIPANLTFKSQVFWRTLQHRNQTASGYELGRLGAYGFATGQEATGTKDKIYISQSWRYANASQAEAAALALKTLLSEVGRNGTKPFRLYVERAGV